MLAQVAQLEVEIDLSTRTGVSEDWGQSAIRRFAGSTAEHEFNARSETSYHPGDGPPPLSFFGT